MAEGNCYSIQIRTTVRISKLSIELVSQAYRNVERYRFIYFNWFVVNGQN